MLLLMFAFILPESHIMTNAGLANLHKVKPVEVRALDQTGKKPTQAYYLSSRKQANSSLLVIPSLSFNQSNSICVALFIQFKCNTKFYISLKHPPPQNPAPTINTQDKKYVMNE